MSRHILKRLSEHFGVVVSFDPLPVPRWTGSGAHTNFSTKQTREKKTGMYAIRDMIEKLRVTHDQHKLVYDLHEGKDNERRLTDGFANVCKMDPFTAAVGLKNVCIRIPQKVAIDGCGYIEDRRPASNCDPYAVLQALVQSTLLSGE
jgi:glutamine synthetase